MNGAGFLQSALVMGHLSQILCHGSVRISIPEEQAADIHVGSISSTFPPPYQLLTEDYIRMNRTTGEVFTTNHRLDREALCPEQPQGEDCIIPHGTIVLVGPEESAVKLIVVVEDINDNPPVFDNTEIHKSVPEDVHVGTTFLLDNQAVDGDTGRNGQLQYHLEGAAGFFTVKVDDSDGAAILFLVVQEPLDRETSDLHRMTLVATDCGSLPLTARAALSVEVTDVDDNCPEFSPDSPRRVNVTAGSPRDTAIAQVRATDRDLGKNAAITYALSPGVSEQAKELFALDSQTGLISLREDLHADTGKEVVLKVLASNSHGHCTPADTRVTVTLLPAPQSGIKIRFLAEHQNQTIGLQENQTPTVLAILELPEDTSPFTGSSSLSIEGEEPFSLSLQNGKYLLSTSKPLDYETKREYRVSVVARRNGGTKTLGSLRKVVRVLVVDVNDNAPQFLQAHYHLDVEENNPPGTSLLTVQALDADGPQNSRVSYRLGPTSLHEPAAIFRIDRVTGQLTASVSLDRERRGVHTLSVLARDSGSPPLESTAQVTIRVLDQNDNAPVFLTPHFFFFVPENTPPLAQVGKVGVTDADAGPNGEVEVRVVNGSAGLFVVDNAQGTLRCTAGLDREQRDRYELLLLATDAGSPSPRTSTARVTVLIEDVNDNRPKVLLPSSNLSCLPVSTATVAGTMLTKIYAVDEDSGSNSEITYKVVAQELPGSTSRHGDRSPFRLDARTGNVTLVKSLVGEDLGMHHLFIVVSDRGVPEALHTTIWVNLLVNDSLAPCHVDHTPTPLPYTRPTATSESSACNLEPEKEGRAQLILLTGLGMIGASLCVLLGTVAFYLKQTRRSGRTQRDTGRVNVENQIPLRIQEIYYAGQEL